MINGFIKNIVDRFGIWRTVQATLASIFVILLTVVVSQFFFPVYSSQADSQAENVSELMFKENISTLLDENIDGKREVITYRSGMFKPATGLKDRPLANKTIERIRDQLKLQCVMEMNGQLVGYINIQGVGLKKCCIGENVNDLFTVLDINKQNKSMDISIVEHKVTLHL